MDLEKLGKYRLISLIATGGMGEVFLARQEGLAGFSKTVVIKRILRHLADDQGFIDMFLNEARLAAQLQHPNIAQIFDLEREDQTWFIAMEHVHGRSLRACLTEARKRNLRFPPRIAARICASALQGLHFAHRLTDEGGRSLGILHRDVSPDNVLVSFAGAVKLVDFGIAKAMTRSFTFTGRLKGKFAYMAPEQFVPGSTIDGRIDVYAMGVLLHELLTLELPANGPRSPDEALTPRVPYVDRADLPVELNAVLKRALDPDPKARFESAETFAHALEEFIAVSGEPLTAAHVAGYLEELFGRDVVMTNPSVATMEPVRGGHTDVLPAPPAGERSPMHSDVFAASLTMIDPDRQGSVQHSAAMMAVPGPAVVPVMKPPPPAPRWPLLLAGGGGALVLVLGVWWALRPGSEPVVEPPRRLDPLPLAVVDAGAAPVEPPVVDAGPFEEMVLLPSDADAGEPPRKHHPPPRLGHVTVRVNPWAEVFYNGKSYGVTPLKHPIDVPPGNASFTLKNPQLGVSRKLTVKVAPGGEVVLKADLFSK